MAKNCKRLIEVLVVSDVRAHKKDNKVFALYHICNHCQISFFTGENFCLAIRLLKGPVDFSYDETKMGKCGLWQKIGPGPLLSYISFLPPYFPQGQDFFVSFGLKKDVVSLEKKRVKLTGQTQKS